MAFEVVGAADGPVASISAEDVYQPGSIPGYDLARNDVFLWQWHRQTGRGALCTPRRRMGSPAMGFRLVAPPVSAIQSAPPRPQERCASLRPRWSAVFAVPRR